MATALNVALIIDAIADYTPSSPHAGAIIERLRNAIGGTRWTDGNGSGESDTLYLATYSLAAGATASYNTLAAGALENVFGGTVDLDELKGLVIVQSTGAVRLEAPATGFLGIFDDASDLLNIPTVALAFDWGAAGLDVTANSKFDITEKTGAATATGTLMFWGAS